MSDNKNQHKIIRVPYEQSPVRIDKFLAATFPDLSRSYLQMLIQSGLVLMNEMPVKASEKVIPEAEINIELEARPQPDIVPEAIDLDIVFEDESLIVIDKPPGMVVHPALGNWSGTVVNALMHHYKSNLSTLSGDDRPGIVHRLDKDTSGLMVIAKNDIVHAALAEQFAEKSAGRLYKAVVWGIPLLQDQKIESFIIRHKKDRKKMTVSDTEGKWAVTHMHVAEEFERVASLCEFKLETGRTHQIRVHAASVGYPVLGDYTYGGRRQGMTGMSQERVALGVEILKNFKRQALHAFQLTFTHPASKKEVSFQADMPEDMNWLIKKLRDFNRG